jgi:DNA-binding GntR family transcriptional regulator
MNLSIKPNLDSIPRPDPLSKIVCEKLRDAILANRLKPDEIYSEKELALQFGVSRTPVREAVRVLLAQNIVMPVAGRGIKINRFTEQELQEVYELRKVLEVAVVEKIAGSSKKNDLNIAIKCLEEQKKAFSKGDYAEIIHLNRLFHTTICIQGGNSRMESVLNDTLDIIQISAKEAVLVSNRGKMQASDRGILVMKEHHRIIDCLLKRDTVQAKQAMIEHLDNSLTAVLSVNRSQKRIRDQ